MFHSITAGELHADTLTYLKYVLKHGDTINITSEFGNAVLISEADYLSLRNFMLTEIANDLIEKNKEALQALANYDGNEPSGIGDLTDDELTRAFQLAVEQENETKRQKGLPIARYDAESNRAYLEYPDMRREYSK